MCGIFNDRSLFSNETNSRNNNNNEDVQVTSNDTNYHIVELQPTDRDILSVETDLDHDSNALNYDLIYFELIKQQSELTRHELTLFNII